MNKVTVFIYVMLLASAPYAQPEVSTHISDYAEVGAAGTKRECPRRFVGTFDFMNLPAPLQETVINFTLTALHSSQSDWQISVWALDNENRVDIVGDSVYVWRAPIAIGDVYSGTIRLVPLMSGFTFLDVGIVSGGIECGLTFAWCLSADGELLYLGNPEIEPRQRVDCDVLTTFFFTPDSVYMTDPPCRQRSDVFGSEIVIQPVPRVKDTSFITFKLTANENFSEGADYQIVAGGMEVVSVPACLDEPIVEGQQLELKVAVVPVAADSRGSISLQIFEDLRIKPRGRISRTIEANFVFDDNGGLKYVKNSGFSSVARKRIPDYQRAGDCGNYGKITVWKSGLVERTGNLIRCDRPSE